MKPTELSIDIVALQVVLYDKPSIEDEIKDTLIKLCRPPETLEELNYFIDTLNTATPKTISGQQPMQVIDVFTVDKGIQKAKFLLVETEDDYI